MSAQDKERFKRATCVEKKENFEDYMKNKVENGLNIDVDLPDGQCISFIISNLEFVNDLKQFLIERQETCSRTCFSLQINGKDLNNYMDLKTLEDFKNGAHFKVIEEPYNPREARIHLKHVRKILKTMDSINAYNGHNTCGLTYIRTVTDYDLPEKRKMKPSHFDSTPPDYILPGAKNIPLTPLHPDIHFLKMNQGVKMLTTSVWNPPHGPRKLHGDILYLRLVTVENKNYYITLCPQGFYVNQSTELLFNPKPDDSIHLCHSLIDLLTQLSPHFKRVYIRKYHKNVIFNNLVLQKSTTAYQKYPWLSPYYENTLDSIQTEDDLISTIATEPQPYGPTRDWNEELQTTREFPREVLSQRLLRDHAVFKVYSDFLSVAARGAMYIIDGHILSINPHEESKFHTYIWNNIFFSLGFDSRDHYKEFGGDSAAFTASRNDLEGLQIYQDIDTEGLHTIGTAIIDYRGHRVTAQTLVPGILDKEPEQTIIYGSLDFGKTIVSNQKFIDLLREGSQHLKMLPHIIMNEQGEELTFCSSVECKGFIGNDGRHYIIDLVRTFPPDVNFMVIPDENLSKEMHAMGYPKAHQHKLCYLRHELLKAFVEDRYIEFIKFSAQQIQRIHLSKFQELENNKNNESENSLISKDKEETISEAALNVQREIIKEIRKLSKNKKNKVTLLAETLAQKLIGNEKQALEISKNACKAVDSLSEIEFDIRFNPDIFNTKLKHSEKTDISKQKQHIKDAAQFLVLNQIPNFILEYGDHLQTPIDGLTLTQALHKLGINVRYLGKLSESLVKIPKLDYLYHLCIQEMIIRATRHIYLNYIQNVSSMNLSTAIAHFLNCFLNSNESQQIIEPPSSELPKIFKRRTKRKIDNSTNKSNMEWQNLTQKSLWQHIKKEIKSHWHFSLNCDNINKICENFKLQRVSILRGFCIKVGIQIYLRDYNFNSSNKVIFNDEDIISVFPVVKKIKLTGTDANTYYDLGQKKLQNGQFKEARELIDESLKVYESTFGRVHTENVKCLRMLARLSYVLGDPQEAYNVQIQTVSMCENANALDHPLVIIEYTYLSLYSFAIGHYEYALKCIYRARYLTLLIFGENHPSMGTINNNISLILHGVSNYKTSLKFSEQALLLNKKYYGKKSIKVALTYHVMAQTYCYMGNFRAALQNEKESYNIYNDNFGEKNMKTIESSEFLKTLTEQGVLLEKAMTNIHTNGKLSNELPNFIYDKPSKAAILDSLNIINGMLFIDISSVNIAKIREDLLKLQDDQSIPVESSMSIKRIIAKINAKNEINGDDDDHPISTKSEEKKNKKDRFPKGSILNDIISNI